MLAVLLSASKVWLCLLCFSVVVASTCAAGISPSTRDTDNIISTTDDDGIYEMGSITASTEITPPSFDMSLKQTNLPAANSSPGLPAATFIVCNQLNMSNVSELNLLGKITIINKFIGIQQPRYQATMLSKLDSRFRSAGYMNIQFAFVYPLAEQRKRSNGSVDGVPQTLLSASVQHNLIVISDPSQSTDLQKLISGATYVIDPCGRLAYIIYFPWSSIQNPFVKAAILSTIYDAPCGPCHIESQHSPFSKMTGTTSAPITSTDAKPLNYSDTQSVQSTNLTISNVTDNETAVDSNNETVTLENNTQTQDMQTDYIALNSTESVTSYITETATNTSSANRLDNFIHRNNFTDEENSNPEDKAYVIPIRVIVPIEHAHAQPRDDDLLGSTYLKYNYLMLKTNDINYHEHLDTDRPEKLKALNTSLQSMDLAKKTTLASELINDTEGLGRYINNNGELHTKEDNTTLLSTNSNTTTDITEHGQQSSNTLEPEQMFVGEDGVRYKALSRDSVPKEFNYLNLVQVRSDEDVSDLEAERNMPLKQQQPEGGYTEKSSAATAYDMEQDQLEDRHYKKILPWIHFRL